VINLRFLKSDECLDQWYTDTFSRILPHLIGYALVFLFYICDNKYACIFRPIVNTKSKLYNCSSLLWDIEQCRLVLIYRRFGTIY